MDIILYSTKTCPRCKYLKQLLDNKNIKYKVCEDIDLMISKGITNIPVLEVDGQLLNNKDAMVWISGR